MQLIKLPTKSTKAVYASSSSTRRARSPGRDVRTPTYVTSRPLYPRKIAPSFLLGRIKDATFVETCREIA
jgi:hypothetical protein